MRKRIGLFVCAAIVAAAVIGLGCYLLSASSTVNMSKWAKENVDLGKIAKSIDGEYFSEEFDIHREEEERVMTGHYLMAHHFPQYAKDFPELPEAEPKYTISGTFFDETDHVTSEGVPINYFCHTDTEVLPKSYLNLEKKANTGDIDNAWHNAPYTAEGLIYSSSGYICIEVYGNSPKECKNYFRNAVLKFQNAVIDGLMDS